MNEMVARGDLRWDSAGVDILLKMQSMKTPRTHTFSTHGDYTEYMAYTRIVIITNYYLPGRQGSLTWRPSRHICAPDKRRIVDEH